MAQGEVSADTLEAYRRASLIVLELLDRVEDARMQAKVENKTAWTLPPNVQAQMLCSWNAFVFQSLGTEFLDADYRDNPSTTGFVPPITADQVMAFFHPVEGWLGRARQAESDPNYVIDVPLPVALPAWSEVEPCPNSHLHGMLAAMRLIRAHAESAVDFLGPNPPAEEAAARQYHAIRGLFANAAAKAQYSDDLHGSNPTKAVHELVEPSIKEAIEAFHRVGQFAAMPRLADPGVKPPPASTPPPPPPRIRPTLPGEPGFDPWCLTDVYARNRLQQDYEAGRAIELLWRYDPDPERTLSILAEVKAAEERRDIVAAKNASGNRLGHFFCAPWGTVWEAQRAVTLGDTRILPHEQFVYDVSAEGMTLGHPFKRHIKKGNYAPTQDFEYGDPSAPPDH